MDESKVKAEQRIWLDESEIKIGQTVWFEEVGKDEKGHTTHFPASGEVVGFQEKGFLKGGVIVKQGEGENEKTTNRFILYPTKESVEEALMVNRFENAFIDKMTDFAEKYVDACKKIMNVTVKSQFDRMTHGSSPSQEAIILDAKMHLQMLGAKFKETATQLTNMFTDKVEQETFTKMPKETRELLLHTDLSQYEPGKAKAVQESESTLSGFRDPLIDTSRPSTGQGVSMSPAFEQMLDGDFDELTLTDDDLKGLFDVDNSDDVSLTDADLKFDTGSALNL